MPRFTTPILAAVLVLAGAASAQPAKHAPPQGKPAAKKPAGKRGAEKLPPIHVVKARPEDAQTAGDQDQDAGDPRRTPGAAGAGREAAPSRDRRTEHKTIVLGQVLSERRAAGASRSRNGDATTGGRKSGKPVEGWVIYDPRSSGRKDRQVKLSVTDRRKDQRLQADGRARSGQGTY